ncbi:FHA domain-containing protein [Chloroflexota bacterium]
MKQRDRSHRLEITALAVMLLLALPVRVVAQDGRGLVDSFDEQLISVRDVGITGSTVAVVYEVPAVASQESLAGDILYILGRCAKEFPDSESIQIECLVGEEVLFEYDVMTADVVSYAQDRLSDEEILSRIRVSNYLPTSDFVSDLDDGPFLPLLGSLRLNTVLVGSVCLGFAGLTVVGLFAIVWSAARSRRKPRPTAPLDLPWGAVSVKQGQASSRTWRLDRQVATIGRSSGTNIVLMDNQVSRIHAEIRRRDGRPVLYDLGSTNGTFVNGKRVVVPCPLQAGDVVRLGSTELIFGPAHRRRQRSAGAGSLVVTRGASQPPNLDLRHWPEASLGRSRTNQIVIGSDPHVSRRHALVRLTAEGHEIVDLSSGNGTFVNGQRVHRALLRPGDRVRLSSTEFVYQRAHSGES